MAAILCELHCVIIKNAKSNFDPLFHPVHLSLVKIPLFCPSATLGQRAYVGKVNMDRNSPDFYVEDTAQSLKDTET